MVLKPGAGAPLDVLMKRKRATETELRSRNPTPTTQPVILSKNLSGTSKLSRLNRILGQGRLLRGDKTPHWQAPKPSNARQSGQLWHRTHVDLDRRNKPRNRPPSHATKTNTGDNPYPATQTTSCGGFSLAFGVFFDRFYGVLYPISSSPLLISVPSIQSMPAYVFVLGRQIRLQFHPFLYQRTAVNNGRERTKQNPAPSHG